jgi:hypothetical protein
VAQIKQRRALRAIANSAKASWHRKPKKPEIVLPTLGTFQNCWCGKPNGHPWKGKEEGKPHPRD